MTRHGLPAAIISLFIAAGLCAQEPIPLAVPAPPPVMGTDVAPTYVESGPEFWARGEYVFWTVGTGKMVEIAKEAYNSDLFNALLDLAGKDFKDVAQTLLGNDRTGFRFSAGVWLDTERTLGVETSFLYANRGPLSLTLGKRDRDPLARLVPNGDIVLQRQREFDPDFQPDRRQILALLLLARLGLPGIDDRTRKQIVIPYGDRDLIDGSITVEAAAKTFTAFDLTGRANVMQSPFTRVDALLGYRHVTYSDSLSVRSEAVTLARPLLPGTRIVSIDDVRTQNTYDGVLFGLDMEASYGPWSIALRPTATIAQLNAEVQRDSARIVTLPERTRLHFAGGTFLRDSEIGEFTAASWTIIPEVALRGTRSFGENVRFLLGSSLLYLPEVARSAKQMEFGLDPDRTLRGRTQGIAQTRLSTLPDIRSLFMMTMSAGLEFRF